MKRQRVALGVIMLAVIGFAAESAFAQEMSGKQAGRPAWPIGQCPAAKHPPKPDGQCPQPPEPAPSCPQPECPDGKCAPPIQLGQCWSQCIIPAKFKNVYVPMDVCFPCSEPVVQQDGTKPETRTVWVKTPTYGYKIPASTCTEKRQIGWQYVQVAEPVFKKVTVRECTPHPEQTIWPAYQQKKRKIKVPYVMPAGVPGALEWGQMPVEVQAAWESLHRKQQPCPPNETAQGMTDCSAVCSEKQGPMIKPLPVLACKDQSCSFRPEHKILIAEYTVEVGIPPQPPPHDAECPAKEITVMAQPPRYERVPVMESVCAAGQPHKFPVPGKKGPVVFEVPKYATKCEQRPPAKACIQQRQQVCKPVLVWRQEAFCQDDGGDHARIIRNVQTALGQAGFDAGPADGALNDKTKQAIRDFQKAKGLAEGGSLTKETMQALGIDSSMPSR